MDLGTLDEATEKLAQHETDVLGRHRSCVSSEESQARKSYAMQRSRTRSKFSDEASSPRSRKASVLTSTVLGQDNRDGAGGSGKDGDGELELNWAEELMLLTHEPLRRDLALLQSATLRIPDTKPPPPMVERFFRFFDVFCGLATQQFSVELLVHCDWLCSSGAVSLEAEQEAESAGIIVAKEYRLELMRHHAEMTQTFQDIAALEDALLAQGTEATVTGGRREVGATATRSMSRMASITSSGSSLAGSLSRKKKGAGKEASTEKAPPPSQAVKLLREGIAAVATAMKEHLDRQETVLPEAIMYRWGGVAQNAPPHLMEKIIDAAAAGWALPASLRGHHIVPLLTWVVHYLHERDEFRAVALVSHLPKPVRKRVKAHTGMFSQDESHDDRVRLIAPVFDGSEEGVRLSRAQRFRAWNIERASRALIREAMRQNTRHLADISIELPPRGEGSAPDEQGSARNVSRRAGSGKAHTSSRATPVGGLTKAASETQVDRVKRSTGSAISSRLNLVNANRDSQSCSSLSGLAQQVPAGFADQKGDDTWWKNISPGAAERALKAAKQGQSQFIGNIKF